MTTSLTAHDIITMTNEDLKKYVSDLGQDPKSMSKTDMHTWLIKKMVPSEAASAVEIPSVLSVVSKLTLELQLQYYLKKEEQEKELELAKFKLEAEERERDKAREAEKRDKAREAERYSIKLDLEARLKLKRLEVSQTQNVPVFVQHQHLNWRKQ